MESFKVPNKQVAASKIVNSNWRNDSREIAAFAKNLPQVRSGLVDEHQLNAWCESVAKLSNTQMGKSTLVQAAGLGAKDMRTLLAAERGEYFPYDSPKELYERKLLERVSLPIGPSAEREKLAVRIATRHIIDSYKITPLADVLGRMARPSTNDKAPWLIGRPALIGEKDGETHLFHVQLTNKAVSSLDANDSIPLFHYDLVATANSKDIDHLHLIKINGNPTYLDALVTASSISSESQRSIIEGATRLIETSAGNIDVASHYIEKDPIIYEELVSAGKQHWDRISRGERIEVTKDPELEVSPAAKEQCEKLSKEFVAMSQIAEKAQEKASECGDRLKHFMKGQGIEDNFTLPYNGASYKKRDSFNAREAAEFLEQKMGIDPAHTRRLTINVDRLTNAYIQTGADLSAFEEYTVPDRKKIETVAHDMGVNLEAFYQRDMTVFVNPKTRGPIYEALEEIKDSVEPDINNLSSSLLHSPIMDQDALKDNTTQSKPRQSKMEV